MGQRLRKDIYRMKEQGVDTTMLNDVIESEFEQNIGHPEDVIWDDDYLVNVEEDMPPQQLKETLGRNSYERFRNVGERHY